MNIQELVDEMRRKADQTPYHPGVDDVLQFRRDVTIDGYEIHVIFMRTTLLTRSFYQLSLGNEDGIPAAIPMALIQRLRAAFLPKGIMIPSMKGNCYQLAGMTLGILKFGLLDTENNTWLGTDQGPLVYEDMETAGLPVRSSRPRFLAHLCELASSRSRRRRKNWMRSS